MTIDQYLWWPQRGASSSQTDEYAHWQKQYGPNLVAKHLHLTHSNLYFPICAGSHIEVEGYCHCVFLTTKKVGRSKPAGPAGAVLKELHLDTRSTGGSVFRYFEPQLRYNQLFQSSQYCRSAKTVGKIAMFTLCFSSSKIINLSSGLGFAEKRTIISCRSRIVMG